MDKTKKKKTLIITIIIILLLALVFWIFRTSDQLPNSNNNINQPPVFTPPSTKIDYVVPEKPKNNLTEFSVLNLAKSYTARFGSWSTDNQGNNLKELLPLSTTKMQDYLNNIELDFSVKEFSGITTKALSAKILDIDDNSAKVLVNTQKIETNANLEKNVYYQEAELSMSNLSNKWLVDKFDWK